MKVEGRNVDLSEGVSLARLFKITSLASKPQRLFHTQ